jgi:hypothetical protein
MKKSWKTLREVTLSVNPNPYTSFIDTAEKSKVVIESGTFTATLATALIAS